MSAHIAGLTEGEAAGIQQFPKPASGSWTAEAGLDKGPVDFRDSYDPEFYELEKAAVFRRSWLNIGRVEQLPRPGTYYTKELPFLRVSLLVIRGMDGEIRAFHNICSHRGNKLVWDDFPDRESKGSCRAISCKYHGWRYDLEGEVSYVHNAPEFFDLQAEELALPKVHLDTWAGFVYINLDETPRQTLREFLGPDVTKLESYPFEKMTQQYVLQADIGSNWKLFMDAFQELYHVPYVHGKLGNPNLARTGTDKIPFMVPFFGVYGKHRLMTSGGHTANKKLRVYESVEGLFRGDNFGPMDVPDVGPLGDGVNPGEVEGWGMDSWQLYPNFVILTWARNWYITYHYWPLEVGRHRFVFSFNFVPPKNIQERLAQEHTVNFVREFGLEDANTLAATQSMLQSGVRDKFFLGDQEVLVRHLRQIVRDDVEAYQSELGQSVTVRGVR